MAPAQRVQQMSMKPKNPPSSAEAAAKRDNLIQMQAAKRLQRLARGAVIRNILYNIRIFEDEVLKKPTPGAIALKQLLPPPIIEATPVKGSRAGSRQSSKTPSMVGEKVEKSPNLTLPVGRRPASPAGSVAGSQLSGSAAGSRKPSKPKIVQPQITVEVLAEYFDKTGCFPPPPEPPPKPEPQYDEYGDLIPEEVEIDPETGLPVEPPPLPPSASQLAAEGVFNMLGLQRDGWLTEGTLQRVYSHHRLRKRNDTSRTHVRLIVVQHGDSCRTAAGGGESSVPPSSALAYGGRELVPVGWTQVTRTAWALRLCEGWAPKLLLCGSLPCCRQTSERLCSILDDPDLREARGSLPGVPEEELLEPFTWDALDYPDRQGGKLGFPVWEVGQKVHEIFNDAEQMASFGEEPSKAPSRRGSKANSKSRASRAASCVGPDPDGEWKPFAPPKPVMLVAGGAALESLLGFLTTGAPRKYLDQIRLGGGDALLLESTMIHRVVGHDGEERVRPDSELWQVALKRSKWKVLRHLRGDGLGQPLGAVPPTLQEVAEEAQRKLKQLGGTKDPAFTDLDLDPDDDDDAPPPDLGTTDPKAFSETRRAYRSYAGEPMIFSHLEFDKLCRRAGSIYHPLDPEMAQKLRPLVRDLGKTKTESRRERYAAEAASR